MVAAVEVVKQQPTAIWLDTFDMLDKGDTVTARRSLKDHLEVATKQQNSAGPEIQPMAIQIVALLNPITGLAEIQPTTLGYTADNLERYRAAFIDQLREYADKYPNIRFIVVLEPHTIPDILATGCEFELQCQRKKDATDLIRHGITTLGNATDKNIYLYLGIGHSAWLTSGDSVKRFPTWLNSLELDLNTVKGFATNTAAYTPLHEELIIDKPSYSSEGFYRFRTYFDEKSLIEQLDKTLKEAMPNSTFGFITDTSRNGWGGADRPTVPGGIESRLDKRSTRDHWCNISTAGIGRTFELDPTDIMANMHAYTWLKQPGYSDGIPMEVTGDLLHACDAENGDALENAPQGGLWFEKHFIQLIQNSWPVLWEIKSDT